MGRVVLTSSLKPGIPGQIPLETRKRENSEDRRTLLNSKERVGKERVDDARKLDFNFRIRTRKNSSEKGGRDAVLIVGGGIARIQFR